MLRLLIVLTAAVDGVSPASGAAIGQHTAVIGPSTDTQKAKLIRKEQRSNGGAEEDNSIVQIDARGAFVHASKAPTANQLEDTSPIVFDSGQVVTDFNYEPAPLGPGPIPVFTNSALLEEHLAGNDTDADDTHELGSVSKVPYAVVYSADSDEINAIVASMRSVIRHTKASFDLYLFIEHEEKEQFENLTQVDGVQVNKKYFSRLDVDPYINKALTRGASANLDIPHNYVRYIMAEQIPEANGMVWMDADTIATANIMTDMEKFLRSKRVVGAFPREHLEAPGIGQLRDIASITNLPIQVKPPYFNAGFMYFSGHRYREGHVALLFQQLVAANNEHKWWTGHGSQPPLNLLLGGKQFFQIRGIKYFNGMGFKKHMATFQEGLYHWNGIHKPWLEHGWYKDLWERYANNTSMAFAETGVKDSE
jgi:lipopolysaccharide biosynthesis glycosyltransferase